MWKRGLAACIGATLCLLAGAQDFPARPVKLLIGYPPGGVPDTIARAVAPSVSATLGQSLLIENRPGAGGLTALQEAARAAPDGYTLLGDSGQWAVLPALRPGVYDFEKSFTPVGQVSTNSLYIVVRSALGVKDFKEFVALMKSKPGGFHYASSGNGTVHHLFMESFKALTGLDIVHVPYKGSAQVAQALLAEMFDRGFQQHSTLPGVKAGQLRFIMVTTRERSKLTPEVPSSTDLGLGELHFAGDVAYSAPIGTPRPIIDRLSAALAKAVAQPELQQRAVTLGVEPLYRTPDQVAEMVRQDVQAYIKAVKVSGAKVD